jgi:hypothetical protein
MASWDSPVVSAPGTANYATPLVNFDAIANLPRDYFASKELALKSREMQRQEDQATAFRGGIPRVDPNNPNSAPDYSAMSERMLQLGNFPQAVTFQNTGIELQRMKNGASLGGLVGPGSGSSAPTAPDTAPSAALPRQNAPSGPAAAGGDQPGSIIGVLTDAGVPQDQIGVVAGRFASALKIDPNNPMTAEQAAFVQSRLPSIRQKYAAAPATDQPSAGSPPQATPAQRVSQGFSDAGIPAHGVPDGSQAPAPAQVADTARSLGLAPQAATAFESRLDAMPVGQRKAYLNQLSTSPAFPKSVNDWAEKRLEAIEHAGEPTSEMKNAGYDAASGGALTRHEATLAGAKEEATAPYKIAANAIREGARPVAVKPNEVVTTGAQLDPALTGFTDWASKRMGVPSGAPAAPAPAPVPAPQGAPRPGTLPTVPSPPLAPNSAAPNPDQPGRSAFTPQLIRNLDGSVASSVTPSTETLQKTAAANYEKARETYSGAQEVQSQLAGMEDAARTLNKSNWSSTGTGGNARLALAKTVNSIWQTLGVKDQNLPFNPDSVASWEKLTKETTRLGFGLARTLGAREAMQIVQGAIKANPNVENTPEGFRMVLNSIRQNAERQSDYFEYATNYAQTHGGDLVGAEVQFNKLNPPSLYARRAIVQARKDIPQEAVEQLRNDPSSAPAFDKHYGGAGLAKMFLGNTRAPGLQ